MQGDWRCTNLWCAAATCQILICVQTNVHSTSVLWWSNWPLHLPSLKRRSFWLFSLLTALPPGMPLMLLISVISTSPVSLEQPSLWNDSWPQDIIRISQDWMTPAWFWNYLRIDVTSIQSPKMITTLSLSYFSSLIWLSKLASRPTMEGKCSPWPLNLTQ